MSNFKLFQPSPSGSWLPADEPRVRLSKKKQINLNQRSWELLGKPDALALYYDEDNKLIALQAADPAAPHAHALHLEKGYTRFIYAGRFLTACKIPDEALRAYRPVVDDDNHRLVIDLNQPVDEPRATR